MRRFLHDETGVASTEYLMLLGILLGSVLFAVVLVALRLSQAYDSWGSFYESLRNAV